VLARNPVDKEIKEGEPMVHILRNIDTELWSKVKTKTTLECKTMHEVIFESPKLYITQVETASNPNKKKKVKRNTSKNDTNDYEKYVPEKQLHGFLPPFVDALQ
jgi:hypothetical protein